MLLRDWLQATSSMQPVSRSATNTHTLTQLSFDQVHKDTKF